MRNVDAEDGGSEASSGNADDAAAGIVLVAGVATPSALCTRVTQPGKALAWNCADRGGQNSTWRAGLVAFPPL